MESVAYTGIINELIILYELKGFSLRLYYKSSGGFFIQMDRAQFAHGFGLNGETRSSALD